MDRLEEVRAFGEHQIRLATDLPFYAEQKLLLRGKDGQLQPFRFNPVQQALWVKIQEQRERLGFARILCVKSRQQGCSSFGSALTTHGVITGPGTSAMIVGHRDSSAAHVYQMCKTFISNLPPEERPPLDVENASELRLKSGSGFSVSVATQDGGGARGQTCRMLHLTELAFFPKLIDNLSATMQILPRLPGTIALGETTPDHAGSEFHGLVLRALAGDAGDWTVFHAPWFLSPEYRMPVPEGFELNSEEKELIALYNLDHEQLVWRRWKLAETGDRKKFEREYSANLSEAFAAAEWDGLIDPADVIHCRKACHDLEPHGELVLGVDVARFGSDSSAVAWRRSRVIEKIEKRRGLAVTEVAGWVDDIIRRDSPARVVIDESGLGAGVVDLLKEKHGDSGIIVGVNFAGKPLVPAPLGEDGKPAGGPANRRAEIWLNLKKALESRRFRIPDDDALMADLVAPTMKYNSNGQIILEAKADMKKRGLPSPDAGDAVALTVFQSVNEPVRKSSASNFNRRIDYPTMVY